MSEEMKTETAEETAEETVTEETNDTAAAEEETDEIAALKAQNEELQKKVDVLKNEYAKAYADTENTRKRLQNEFAQRSKYMMQSFALEVLPVLDNCERALAIEVKDDTDANYRKGFEMVYRQLLNALNREGVQEIEALNQPFDPNWHQAMLSEHCDGVEPGMNLQVLQKGYKLKDRLLRAAMVKVSE